MKKRSGLTTILFAAIIAVALVTCGFAQERPARPAQKPADDAARKDEVKREPETQEEALRRVIAELSQQIGLLTAEMKKLRQDGRATSMTLELLLSEERLARVEEKLDEAMRVKNQLNAREQEIHYRQRNIPQEVARSGVIRRSEAEAMIRADLQKALEDVHNQQGANQQRLADLQFQADRLRQRVELLRQRLERAEGKEPQQ